MTRSKMTNAMREVLVGLAEHCERCSFLTADAGRFAAFRTLAQEFRERAAGHKGKKGAKHGR